MHITSFLSMFKIKITSCFIFIDTEVVSHLLCSSFGKIIILCSVVFLSTKNQIDGFLFILVYKIYYLHCKVTLYCLLLIFCESTKIPHQIYLSTLVIYILRILIYFSTYLLINISFQILLL